MELSRMIAFIMIVVGIVLIGVAFAIAAMHIDGYWELGVLGFLLAAFGLLRQKQHRRLRR